METISFVIPVYRNERAVTLTHEKIRGLFDDVLSQFRYEMVFVDDGSDDSSLNELLEIRRKDKRVKIISFTRNFGQMAAILAGMKEARGELVVVISADMQDPVDLVPQMVREAGEGAEVVACYRTERDDGFPAKLASGIFYRLVRVSYPTIPSGGFDYVLMRRNVVDAFNRVNVRNRFFQGDLLWFGFRTKFIPYKRRKREIGKSQYTFGKKLKNFIDAVLDSSYLPIRLMSLLGLITALLGFLYAVNIVYSRLVNHIPSTGWAPIMIVILVIGGLLMVMLGVIGEYIWRIYDEVKKKPNYFIKDKYL